MNGELNLDQIEWIKDVQRVHLEPSDVLIIRVRGELCNAAAAHLKTRLQGKFPNNEVVVLDGDVEIGVVGVEDTL